MNITQTTAWQDSRGALHSSSRLAERAEVEYRLTSEIKALAARIPVADWDSSQDVSADGLESFLRHNSKLVSTIGALFATLEELK